MATWINNRIERAPVNFALAIGWDPRDDSIDFLQVTEGVPEQYVIFCVNTWLKKYEQDEAAYFSRTFFPAE